MAKWLSTLCILLICMTLRAQVTVVADTSIFARYHISGAARTHANRLSWQLRQQDLHWGDSITIREGSGIDTLFFQQSPLHKWDSLVCDLRGPHSSRLTYNECCGGFDVRTAAMRGVQGGVQVQLLNPKRGRQYLALLDEAGMFLKAGENDTLWPGCRSAMAPNCYWIALYEVLPCNAVADCDSLACEWNGHEFEYEITTAYREPKALLGFRWLPLGAPVARIAYDARTGKWRFR